MIDISQSGRRDHHFERSGRGGVVDSGTDLDKRGEALDDSKLVNFLSKIYREMPVEYVFLIRFCRFAGTVRNLFSNFNKLVAPDDSSLVEKYRCKKLKFNNMIRPEFYIYEYLHHMTSS